MPRDYDDYWFIIDLFGFNLDLKPIVRWIKEGQIDGDVYGMLAGLNLQEVHQLAVGGGGDIWRDGQDTHSCVEMWACFPQSLWVAVTFTEKEDAEEFRRRFWSDEFRRIGGAP